MVLDNKEQTLPNDCNVHGSSLLYRLFVMSPFPATLIPTVSITSFVTLDSGWSSLTPLIILKTSLNLQKTRYLASWVFSFLLALTLCWTFHLSITRGRG